MSIFMSKFALDDYSAMQGPCPEGFHIPTKDEWAATYNIRIALGGSSSSGGDFAYYLKMPAAGLRSSSNGDRSNVNSVRAYWSATPNSTSSGYLMYIYSPLFNYHHTLYRSYGCNIRPFKDTSVIPTSSWTKLYGTSIERGGIFWSSTNGLISLSSDGQTRITMSDKNLGATTARSSGTLSQANSGNYYQRGNNYGFPFTGTISTTSSQIDASSYGPGNYYSSAIFRYNSSGGWDSSNNGNLRGGETGVVQSTGEPKKIYIRVQAQPITVAGIYHNSDLGLISLSSDGSNWITIADKNLGATTVYNSGDTLSEANCGKYYQWGNNYGFPFTGGVTTSSTKVNASTYGPGNYYSSSTFITANPRDNSGNNNLRGGETGTNEAMKGPCSSGFHIPLSSERNNIYTIWTTLGGGASDGTNFGIALKLPFGGYRSRTDASVTSLNSLGQYWASNIYIASFAYALLINSSSINSLANGGFSFGMMVRPFKNEAVQPDDSRTKLY